MRMNLIFKSRFPRALGALALIFLVASSAQSARPWTIQDVSVLFPLPAQSPDPNAFLPATRGQAGEWLPDELLAELPRMEVDLDPTQLRERLQVVGVRFDPPEVRLVWQAFRTVAAPGGGTRRQAIDAAVHTFYRIEPSREAEFMREYRKLTELSNGSASESLAAHSSLAREGWSGAYGRGLRALMLKWVGRDRMTRFTFMSVLARNLQWRFGGFDVEGENLHPMIIPRIRNVPSKVQIFVNNMLTGRDYFGGIGPAPEGQDELNRLVSDSTKAEASEPAKLQAAHATVRRLENPRIFRTDELDCASCHVAQSTKLWIESRRPDLARGLTDAFISNAANLRNSTRLKARTDNVRMFGYFEDAAAISDRTIFESALVVERLNAVGR